MQRNTLLILIVVAMLSLGGFLWWKTSQKTTTTPGQTQTDGGISFNPFGSSSPATDTPETTSEGTVPTKDQTAVEIPGFASKFHPITNFAVSGATFFIDNRPLVKAINAAPKETAPVEVVPVVKTDKKTSAKKTEITATPAPQQDFELAPSLRYVEKGTGHIYQMFLDTKASGKVSNYTIPAIYEAPFGNNANSVLYRYLSGPKIATYMATLGGKNGEFLPEDVSDVTVSPDGTKFFYIAPFADGISGTIRSFVDTKKTQIFTSPFTEWLTQWATNDSIFLTTKASYDSPGYIYKLSTINGSFTKVLGGINGLTSLGSNDGATLLYSNTTPTGPSLALYTIAKHQTINTTAFGLPEKCVWNKTNTYIYCALPNTFESNMYPDNWYKGITSFNDNFAKINATTGESTLLAQAMIGQFFDATHLFLDEKEQTLFFTNKKDGTLWSLDIK